MYQVLTTALGVQVGSVGQTGMLSLLATKMDTSNRYLSQIASKTSYDSQILTAIQGIAEGMNDGVAYGPVATANNTALINSTLNTTLSYLKSALGSGTVGIDDLLSKTNTSLSSISGFLSNSAGSAIQSLQTLTNRNAYSSGGTIYTTASLLYGLRDVLRSYMPSLDASSASIASRLLYSDGTSSYTVSGLLYGLRDLLRSYFPSMDSSLSFLSDVYSSLNHSEGSTFYTAGGLLYGIRDLVSSYLPSFDSSLSLLPSVASRLLHSEGGTTYTAASLLYGLRDLLSSYLPGFSSSLSELGDSVIPGIQAQTGVLTGALGNVIEGLETGSKSIVDALGSLVIDVPQDLTVSTDVAGTAAQSATLWDTIVGEVDTPEIETQMDACVGFLRTSFPFGLIFVVVDTIGALSAPPAAPVIEADLPMVVGSYHVVLDLSYFDSVAALFRGGFVVLYAFGLWSSTKQWVFNAGGDSV